MLALHDWEGCDTPEILSYFEGHDYTDKKEISFDGSYITSIRIIIATYIYDSSEGYAWVLFIKEDKLYEIICSHHSEEGLVGQWEPIETTKEELESFLSSNEKIIRYGFNTEDIPLMMKAVNRALST